MYNFESVLLPNEVILYQGRSVPGKGSKVNGGSIFLICFALILQTLMIWSVATDSGDGFNFNFIFIFLILTFFGGLGAYDLIYNLIFKKICVADDYYCLTNKRAMKYESKKNKLVFGYLINYVDIKYVNVKDNYGDVYMGVVLDEKNYTDGVDALGDIKDILLNPNPENMPIIKFESIEDPKKIANLVRDTRLEILKNNNKAND